MHVEQIIFDSCAYLVMEDSAPILQLFEVEGNEIDLIHFVLLASQMYQH